MFCPLILIINRNPVESSRKPSQIKFQDVEIDDNEVSS